MQSNKIIEITSAHQVLNDLAQLTKFRLTVSVVISSLAGYFLAIDTNYDLANGTALPAP